MHEEASCYDPLKKKTGHTSATAKKTQQNTNLPMPRLVLLQRSLRLVRVLRAQTLQNLSCELFLAVLDLNICSGQLEAFLPQHDPHLIPRCIGIRSTLFEPGTRVRVCLAIFCSSPFSNFEKLGIKSTNAPINSSLLEHVEVVGSGTGTGVGVLLCKCCTDELQLPRDEGAGGAGGDGGA